MRDCLTSSGGLCFLCCNPYCRDVISWRLTLVFQCKGEIISKKKHKAE